jgi:hypothetical protein
MKRHTISPKMSAVARRLQRLVRRSRPGLLIFAQNKAVPFFPFWVGSLLTLRYRSCRLENARVEPEKRRLMR